VIDQYASNELRVTVNQGYLIRFVRPQALRHLFNALDELGLAEPGFDSVADITACPGTESCALAISDSTAISLELEKVIREEYPDLIRNQDIKIKISGCPNSCGQHGLAGIGLHGSSIKDKQGKVVPALIVLLGGGTLGNGDGVIADKIGIKIPTRRGPQALRLLLDDYETNGFDGEYYHSYYQRLGKNHFYSLLKPLGDLSNLEQIDYIDWGQDELFLVHTTVGECAGVMIDLVATLLLETQEKLEWSKEAFDRGQYADSIYHTYSAFINTAKALLLTRDIKPATHIQTLNDFQENFVANGLISGTGDFKEFVLRINKNEPTEQFALSFWNDCIRFLDEVQVYRNAENVVVEK
jgi:sulfite reductase (ferredoxin)